MTEYGPTPLARTPVSDRTSTDPVRILRVIARMNGGAAYSVAVLAGRVDPVRYPSLLVHGTLARDESSELWRAEREGCRRVVVKQLGPEIRPLTDLWAVVRLVRLVRHWRPDIVETHTAKAGVVGRLAAVLATRPRPVIIHTYHGHVLEGYFGRTKSMIYRQAERWLARISDTLVAVSDGTADDLVRLRVAERQRFRVINLGLDLQPFMADLQDAAASVRARLAVPESGLLLVFVGRLVPIKRVDVLLRALGRLRDAATPVHLAIAGAGGSRADLEQLSVELGLQRHVTFLGHMQDVTAVTAAADIAVLSSDNEGTPMSLIEAGAAGKPSVATAAGGVPEVVLDGLTGRLIERGDDRAMADAIRQLAEDPRMRARMGAQARSHVLERYSSRRLVHDVETLYEDLLRQRGLC